MDENVVEMVQVLTSLVVAVFCVVAVPFAIRVSARLASIDTTLKEREWQAEAIEDLRKQLQAQELKCAGRHGD